MGIYKIREKDGRLRYVVSRRWPGKQGRVRVRCDSLAQAKALMARINDSIACGSWRSLRSELAGEQQAVALTVGAAIDRFMAEYCRPRLRGWKDYERSLKRVAEFCGDVPLHGLRRRHAHEFVAMRQASGMKPASVNREVAALKSLCSWAVDNDLLPSSPLAGMGMLREQRREWVPLEPAEVDRLLESAEDRFGRFRPYLTLLAETGIRRAEGLSLRWEQVDWARRVLTTARTKNFRPRSIPLSERAVEALAGLPRIVGEPRVFARGGKAYVTPEDALDRARRAAGLEGVGFHDLRRYRATQWHRNGLDVREIAELLGHSSLETTRRYLGIPKGLEVRVREAQNRESRAQNGHNARGMSK